MTKLNFGDMVYLPFPFAECDGEKNRWGFVLADAGENVVVAYCTTNPEVQGSIRLDKIEGKVSNLVAYRWESISKERIIHSKGIRRASLKIQGLLSVIGKICKVKKPDGEFWFGGYAEQILANVIEAKKWVEASSFRPAFGHSKR